MRELQAAERPRQSAGSLRLLERRKEVIEVQLDRGGEILVDFSNKAALVTGGGQGIGRSASVVMPTAPQARSSWLSGSYADSGMMLARLRSPRISMSSSAPGFANSDCT